MQNFSIEEINERIAHHSSHAERFMNLFNAEIVGCGFVVTTEKNTIVAGVSAHNRNANDHLKRFFYEMSVHHVNERIKWELTRGESTTVGQ